MRLFGRLGSRLRPSTFARRADHSFSMPEYFDEASKISCREMMNHAENARTSLKASNFAQAKKHIDCAIRCSYQIDDGAGPVIASLREQILKIQGELEVKNTESLSESMKSDIAKGPKKG